MNKPSLIETKPERIVTGLVLWIIAVLLFLGAVGVMARYPNALVGVGEEIRSWVLEHLSARFG